MTCRNKCGRPAFAEFPTCCVHCVSAAGPHAADCEQKARQTLGERGQKRIADEVAHSESADTKKKVEEVLQCCVANCNRFPFNGKFGNTCCRTCETSNGCDHGKECNTREEFCAITDCRRNDAAWYLKKCGGDLECAVGRFLTMQTFTYTCGCSDWDAWNILQEADWDDALAAVNLKALREFCAQTCLEERFAREYLKRAAWNVELAMVEFSANFKVVQEFCNRTGCDESDAWKYVKRTDWNIEQALLDFERKDEVYHIACPYRQLGDCDQVWPVTREDLNCCKVRCGIVKWRGEEHQLPRHGVRQEVERYLWPSGEGWPGKVFGCGRPFCFPKAEKLCPGKQYDGMFLSWDDNFQGTLDDVVNADPNGDYSRVTEDKNP